MNTPVIASIGAGRMGRGIAVTFALAGMPVYLLDIKARESGAFEILQNDVFTELEGTLNMLGEIGFPLSLIANTETTSASKHQDEQKKLVTQILSRVHVVAQAQATDALAKADYVFEAVPETLPAKKAAFEFVSAHAADKAVVASTTSTILSNDLQPLVKHPERFLNAHWLNPAFLVPLVELSPGELTDDKVVQQLKQLLESMGKVPVVCAASPGYIVPRIQALAMNEAARMAEEGVATVEDIDKATRYGFGFRFAVLGLLEFIDWGGGDILYHASRYMVDATGDSRHASPPVIEKNMKENRIGLSTGEGFLDYENIDIDAYRKQRLSAFVAMLKHIDKMPVSPIVNPGKQPV